MAKDSSKGGGGGGATKATNAMLIENMNEQQIDKEMAATQRKIDAAERTMQKNDITNAGNAKAMREAFPLGVGGDGWSKQRAKARDKGLENDAKKAKAYTEAYEQKQAAEARLEALKKAKTQIKGTGKTLKQITEERARAAVKNAGKTLKWKTTQKAEWVNGGYKPKIISAGDFQIMGSGGLYQIFKNGKLIGRTDKLSKAQAFAEKNK